MRAAGRNGAALGPDGAVYLVQQRRLLLSGRTSSWGSPSPARCPRVWTGGSIQRVDLATGEVTTLYTKSSGRPLRAPNDLVFDAHGGFWFTDHGVRQERTSDRTGLHYAQPDGSSCEEVVFPLDAPNGIGLSPDGSVLYTAETHTGRVYSWPVTAPGRGGHHHPPPGTAATSLAGLPGMQMLDSLAVDGEGWVCVGTLVNGGSPPSPPDGAVVEHTPLPDPLVTNICFGGPDQRTAFCTLSGTGQLVAFDWPRPGLRLPFAR